MGSVNTVNWGKSSMGDKQPEAKLMVSQAVPQIKLLSATRDSHSHPLQFTTGVSLARDTSTLSMNSQPDLTGLLQQLIQIAATTNAPASLFAQLAKTVGTAFQVDGCAMIVSTVSPEQVQTTCWLAETDVIAALPRQTGYEHLIKRVSCSQPLISPGVQFDSLNFPVKATDNSEDAESVWQYFSISAGAPLIQAVLEMPTQFQGSSNGIISLMRSRPHPWSPYEIEQLELVSQHIAVIISQFQLQQQVSLQLQFQAVVNQLTLAIRNTSDLNEVLKLATDGTAQALNVQRALLLRLKYSDPLFRSHASEEMPKTRVSVMCEWLTPTGWTDPNSPTSTAVASAVNQSFWLSECGLSQRIFKSVRPTAVDHKRYLLNEADLAKVNEIFKLDTLDALLVAPLESQGTVLGFLVFQSRQPRSWQQAEIDLVELVGAQVSNAIIQTETLRQVQSLVEKRTADLQQSLAIQAKLYERTRQQVEQLRQLNQLKDEFLDTVSHELRTPLTSMALAIRMLRQIGTDSDSSNRYLDILEQQCAQETNLVNDLLALRELESKQIALQLEDIDVIALLQDLATNFQQQWAPKGLTLKFEFPDHPVRIQSDRDSLNRTLLELLTNAGKYSSSNSTIHLKLLYRREVPTNQIILTLSNSGSGISPEELPYVFDKFRRCQGATQNAIQGTGLGLALVKSLVQHLNGTISASSAPTEDPQIWETCFSLILPQSFDTARL
ncbi:MAG: GAF domain-containing protein [Oscillatoriales cyanobacterium C42_A2020_001]|nr:GAF domain-containing protein [Leptolyngbyaceae cyanobacterium C42_A2020_001]